MHWARLKSDDELIFCFSQLRVLVCIILLGLFTNNSRKQQGTTTQRPGFSFFCAPQYSSSYFILYFKHFYFLTFKSLLRLTKKGEFFKDVRIYSMIVLHLSPFQIAPPIFLSRRQCQLNLFSASQFSRSSRQHGC